MANKNMAKKKQTKNNKERDFTKEYAEIFSILGRNSANIVHEWNKEGDRFKKFSLYKESPKTILTTHTIPLKVPRLTKDVFPVNQ